MFAPFNESEQLESHDELPGPNVETDQPLFAAAKASASNAVSPIGYDRDGRLAVAGARALVPNIRSPPM